MPVLTYRGKLPNGQPVEVNTHLVDKRRAYISCYCDGLSWYPVAVIETVACVDGVPRPVYSGQPNLRQRVVEARRIG